MLVKSTLHSLTQLRDHLTVRLSGMRIADKRPGSLDPADARDPADKAPRFVRNPANRTRWGVISEASEFGEMVIKLETDPPPPLVKKSAVHEDGNFSAPYKQVICLDDLDCLDYLAQG